MRRLLTVEEKAARARAKTLAYQRRLRVRSISVYGGKCACCGEKTQEFLSIDHIYGGGRKHRREVSGSGGGSRFYQWLQRAGFPPGFRVLCYNCNCSLGFYGRCPHGGAQRLQDETDKQEEIRPQLSLIS